MVEKYDALDWQSFSQKKNIEEIAKNTREKKKIETVATIEIAMTVFSIISSSFFDENIPQVICWLIGGVAGTALLWLFCIYAKEWYKKSKRGSDIPDVSQMIDLFDNEICYYALMAESYMDKIENIDVEKVSNLERFYYIEACFYINKAMYSLSLTSSCHEKLYSADKIDVYGSKLISYTRLKNVLDIIDECIGVIEDKKEIIFDIDKNQAYMQTYGLYRENYKVFKEIVEKG